MRILVLGAGGVGSAAVSILARRCFFERVVVADYDLERARRAVDGYGDRFTADRVDASDAAAVAALVVAHGATHVLNAVDPRFTTSVFEGALDAGADYLDLAMSLSTPHPQEPYSRPGVKLGDEQFAAHARLEAAGRLALVGMGVEPGLSDVFARYAVDHLFTCVDELGTRDGSNLVVEGADFAPSFSIWTTIEECLNPPLVWEVGSGWRTTEPFSDPEVFDFPGGIGPVECVNVEHEEVVLMPRWLQARKVTFKYGLGADFIAVLRTLHRLGLDATTPVPVRGADGAVVRVSPRDVVAACLPDPATLGERMRGTTCAGLLVTGLGLDGMPREVYLHHLVDNEWSMREYGHQCVVWQTAVNPVVALELLARGVWSGTGVLGPEAFDAVPFLDLLTEYGTPWHLQERTPRG